MQDKKYVHLIQKALPFTTTQDAIIFGQLEMTEAYKRELQRGIKLRSVRTKRALKNRDWELATVESFISQLCRESIMAYEGSIKLRGQV